jgi:hypothetical protein
MSKFKRDIMTIPHWLHGDLVVNCYVCKGLAIANTGTRWNVYHHASGICISGRISRATLTGAKTTANRLLALPIDWEMPRADVVASVREHADAIREIAK